MPFPTPISAAYFQAGVMRHFIRGRARIVAHCPWILYNSWIRLFSCQGAAKSLLVLLALSLINMLGSPYFLHKIFNNCIWCL